jgi:PLP dependent protein
MTIAEKIADLKKEIPDHVQLIAVTKTRPVADIMEAYQAGMRSFGENRVQELVQKQPQLPKDIEWHLIGHLQTNKVKFIAPFVHMIHSVDSLKLLVEINQQALKFNRTIPCLLEIRIAREETKFGLTISEAQQLLKSDTFKNCSNILISGLMGMATFTENAQQVKEEFSALFQAFHRFKNEFFPHASSFKEISMGMSGDYQLAIECGATMVRIGTSIFGERF